MKSDVSHQTIIRMLANAQCFKQMDPGHLRALAEFAMPSSFEGGEFIFREGDTANRFYLLLDGSVALESQSRERDAIHIQTIGEGDVLGWSWLFAPYIWHFGARAIDPVKVLFFYGSRLREHCEDDHDFGYELIKCMAGVMVSRLQATRRQLFEISDLALRSQWEALQLAAQLGSAPNPPKSRIHSTRSSAQPKTQTSANK